MPSHDTTPLLSFLVLRILTTHNIDQPCCPFLSHFLLSSLWFLSFSAWFLLFLWLSLRFIFFFPLSIASNSILTFFMSQTSFGHISINSSTIPMVSMASKSPWKDLLINTSHVSRQSVMAKILSRSTSNHYVTIY